MAVAVAGKVAMAAVLDGWGGDGAAEAAFVPEVDTGLVLDVQGEAKGAEAAAQAGFVGGFGFGAEVGGVVVDEVDVADAVGGGEAVQRGPDGLGEGPGDEPGVGQGDFGRGIEQGGEGGVGPEVAVQDVVGHGLF